MATWGNNNTNDDKSPKPVISKIQYLQSEHNSSALSSPVQLQLAEMTLTGIFHNLASIVKKFDFVR